MISKILLGGKPVSLSSGFDTNPQAYYNRGRNVFRADDEEINVS